MVKAGRLERVNILLRNLASSFIKKEIDLKAIITVMRVETSGDLRAAKIFVSVFPENKEKEILQLLKSKVREFHGCLRGRLKTKFLPIVSFEIDQAIKMERKIESVLKNNKAS